MLNVLFLMFSKAATFLSVRLDVIKVFLVRPPAGTICFNFNIFKEKEKN